MITEGQRRFKMRAEKFEDGQEFLVAYRVLYTGLVYIARYRESSRAKYKRRVSPAMKQVQSWVDNGAITCVYMKYLLGAEIMGAIARAKKNRLELY